MDIFNDIKRELTKKDVLSQLIYINVMIFIIIRVLDVVGFLFQSDIIHIIQWFAMPADYNSFFTKPWSIISYMFVHQSFLHLLFNLLWLYFGGKLFLAYMNQKQLLSVYILGGIAGGLCFSIAYNIFPVFSAISIHAIAIGASASVLAIVFAVATYIPNHKVRFIFIGNVSLKYLALFLIILDILSIPKGNSGGHIAHIGGAIFGFLYIKQLQAGNDLSKYVTLIMDYLFNLFKTSNKFKKAYKKRTTDQDFRNQRATNKKQIDAILEKISKSGYDSLTKEEKSLLFESSKK